MSVLFEGRCLAERFTVLHRLGRGATGEVWLARDAADGSGAALKVLDPEILAAPGIAPWLDDRLARVRSLRHPRLVPVAERIDLDGHRVYRMAAFAGEDFDRFRGRPWREILAALDPVLDALALAQAQNLVHGGIKASNLLCDATGRVHLADLAFAGLVHRCPGARARVPDRATGGWSPQVRAGAPPGPADDVYALGALLYEWIAGRPPFRAGRPADGAAPRLLAPLAPRDGRGEPVPGALERLVSRMLAEATEARPADVASVRAALATLEGGGDAVASIAMPAEAPAAFPIRPAAVVMPVGAPSSLEPEDEHRIGIVPVDLGTATPPLRAPAGRGGGDRVYRRLMLAALGTMLLGAIGVFYLLPRAVESRLERQAQRAREALDAAPTPRAVAGAAAEAAPETGGLPAVGAAPPDLLLLARQREAARDALAQIARERASLEERSVGEWAAEEYAAVQLAVASGEALLDRRDYARAAATLQEALSRLRGLDARAAALLEESLQAGDRALDAADAEEATARFSLALKLDPESAAAQRGLARAERIDEVFARLRSGERHEANGALEKARDEYRGATELDPDLERARSDLARIEDRIAGVRYRESMSAALTALGRRNFEAARRAFEAALGWRPGAAEATEGLAQAKQGLRLAKIARLRDRAAELAATERWDEAIEQYEAALALDPALAFAQAGKARAARRAALDTELEGYLDDPDRLGSPPVHARALQVLAQAAAVPDPGPRLERQIAVVGRLVELAGRPIRVEIESDLATEVVLYRVGRLGSFDRRELELRPGTYTVVGTREGYRDVRKRFTVRPGEPPPPVVVRCEERI
jgi:tetratricopeptide (TPR) repeat protein